MKASSLLLLALAVIGFAAPAPPNTANAPGAVQPVYIDTDNATNIAARSVTADSAVPENLYRVSLSFSEYCENGAPKARAWMSNGATRFELPFHTAPTANITLHSGEDLIFGPYSYDQHAFKAEYDGCVWTSEGGYPCGWCETQPWSLEELNCQTGQPGNQRLTYRTCYFVDTHMDSHAANALTGRNEPVDTPTPSTPLEHITFKLASATVTAQPELLDALHATPPNQIVDAQASTVTLMPAIIETAHPIPLDRIAFPQTDIILPFHLQIWEYCSLHGERLAAGVYTNGNMKQALDLQPGVMISVNHRVPGYSNLEIGPFDYGSSRVRFGYADGNGGKGCEWWDHETWKSCGECRAGLWSRGPINCADPRSLRFKDMDCSVLLGMKASEEVE